MPDDLNTLRHIEGFPIGEDADILALSDPPHYTAYPNPHIGEFIKKWGKPYDEATDDYHREPYVTDVSEGKNDPIYNAHSYHTKVPYKAIIPFIEHYTEPGDIVLDGFCGSGMTGVAAQMVGRRAILCDLSPAATFITHNYNTQVDVAAFAREAKRILAEVEAECGWMYETRHTDGRIGRINYTVWSDVFICPYCAKEIIFWDAAVDDGEVNSSFRCPHCFAEVTKRNLTHATELAFDNVLGTHIRRARQTPVLINYNIAGRRYDKRPDAFDLDLVRRIEAIAIPYWFPTVRIDQDIDIWYERDYRSLGIYAIHHFYTQRNLYVLSAIWHRTRTAPTDVRKPLQFVFTGALQIASRMSSFRFDSRNPQNTAGGILKGALYVPSLSKEGRVTDLFERRLNFITRMFSNRKAFKDGQVITATCSASSVPVTPTSVDYIFTDPPFGSNIIYSDLSLIWESWLRVFTEINAEAVVHRRKKHGTTLDGYRQMMTSAFSQMYETLKPGRWITVVFHNSKASVWNAIQESLARAGFLVAQVTVLDKQQSSFKQVTAPGAVKNDLVINAYKPRAGFTQRFISTAGQGLEADFVRQHLQQLPLAANAERSREMLYSKYLAYYVQHGYQVAYNGDQFYRALGQWGCVERDGYWFADEAQANEYEKRKAGTLGARSKRGTSQTQAVLFISDERSARQWLWNFLATPQSYSDIYTAYTKALQTSEDELPEPRTMLEEGFLQVGSLWRRPDALTQAELDKRRQERLLHQFAEYLTTAKGGRPLKEVRKEALVAGFTEAYRTGRYADILAVGRKLPKRLLEDSPDIYDFVDIAEAKVEG